MKNELSAKLRRSVPARVRNGAIATAIILLLLVFTGVVQAAGDAEWNDGVNQVNSALRHLRSQAQGVPGAMQYVNQAEKLWKQAQAQWALQQRNQQQNAANQMRTQLLAQQQNLMNQLNKQQQFLQQQLSFLNTPLKKKMDQDSLQHFGRLLQPDMNAKGGPGWEAWKEAMSQLASISNPTPPAKPSQTPSNKGSYDKPLTDNATVKLFDPPEYPFESMKTKPPPPLSSQTPNKLENMSNLSDEQLESRRQTLITQLKGLQKSSENITAQHNENAVMIQENENQAKSDVKDVIERLPGKKVFGKNIPDIPIEFTEDSSPKPKPSPVEKGIDKAIEVIETTPIPDGSPLKKPLEITAETLKTGEIAGHTANSIQTDVYVISNQGKLQPQLDQIEQERKSVFDKLKATIEEQNRRKSALTSDKQKQNADSATTPQSITPTELELGRREIPKTEPKADSGWREIPMDPKWINNE